MSKHITNGVLLKQVRKSGLSARSSKVALAAVSSAIRALLAEGCNVNIPHVGLLFWKGRTGRHHPGSKWMKAHYQKPSAAVKFRLNLALKAALRKVTPKRVEAPHRYWSNERRLREKKELELKTP